MVLINAGELGSTIRTRINQYELDTDAAIADNAADIASMQLDISDIQADITDIQADIAALRAEQVVHISGLLSLPTTTTTTSTVTIGATTAKIVKNGEITTWTYDGEVYTPTFGGVPTSQYCVLSLQPDWTTELTTKKLKIVETTGYKGISFADGEHVCLTIGVIRASGLITGEIYRYMSSPRGTTIAQKVRGLLSGSTLISGYNLSPESVNFGGATGAYFAQSGGASDTYGRNTVNNEAQTHIILADAARQGASANQTITVAGLGLTGTEGQLFYRQTGALARVLGGQAPMYEPTPANATTDYVAVPANNYAAYLLLTFPGSQNITMCPPITSHNSFQAAIDAAVGTTGLHQYLKSPYNKYDRWMHAIGQSAELGYLVLKGSFAPASSWASQTAAYKFYDRFGIDRGL